MCVIRKGAHNYKVCIIVTAKVAKGEKSALLNQVIIKEEGRGTASLLQQKEERWKKAHCSIR